MGRIESLNNFGREKHDALTNTWSWCCSSCGKEFPGRTDKAYPLCNYCQEQKDKLFEELASIKKDLLSTP